MLFIDSREAEAIKLFANTYLAMRVSFFNVIRYVCGSKRLRYEANCRRNWHDPRIGNYYNNPSFGYGGYCLPKDTKQMLANYASIPNNIIQAIVDSNDTRKDHIATMITERKLKTVGIYRLTMKTGSDNFGQSAIQDVIERVKAARIEVVVYEPVLEEDEFDGLRVVKDFEAFKQVSDVIVANRLSEEIKDVRGRVYTRDLFSRD